MSSFLEEEVEKESTSVYFTPPNFKDLFLTKVYPNSNHSVFTSSYVTNAEKIGVFSQESTCSLNFAQRVRSVELGQATKQTAGGVNSPANRTRPASAAVRR